MQSGTIQYLIFGWYWPNFWYQYPFRTLLVTHHWLQYSFFNNIPWDTEICFSLIFLVKYYVMCQRTDGSGYESIHTCDVEILDWSWRAMRSEDDTLAGAPRWSRMLTFLSLSAREIARGDVFPVNYTIKWHTYHTRKNTHTVFNSDIFY